MTKWNCKIHKQNPFNTYYMRTYVRIFDFKCICVLLHYHVFLESIQLQILRSRIQLKRMYRRSFFETIHVFRLTNEMTRLIRNSHHSFRRHHKVLQSPLLGSRIQKLLELLLPDDTFSDQLGFECIQQLQGNVLASKNVSILFFTGSTTKKQYSQGTNEIWCSSSNVVSLSKYHLQEISGSTVDLMLKKHVILMTFLWP